MGKVKRARNKAHYIKPGLELLSGPSQSNASLSRPSSRLDENSMSTLFSGFSIDVNQLTPWTAEQSANNQSISSQTNLQKLLAKKESRRKLRHKAFLKKIHVNWNQEQEKKKKEAKQKKDGNFYLQTLDDALPTLETLMKDYKPKRKKTVSQKPRLCQSHKAQKIATVNDIKSMQRLLKSNSIQGKTDSIWENLDARLKQDL